MLFRVICEALKMAPSCLLHHKQTSETVTHFSYNITTAPFAASHPFNCIFRSFLLFVCLCFFGRGAAGDLCASSFPSQSFSLTAGPRPSLRADL